ncbi:MAG: hypothetical protein IT456_12730 [Planctomycetes bacterium]|nr:hypothetical protein [Planctomycetota bacterium]
MGTTALRFLPLLLPQLLAQQPAVTPALPGLHPEVVLADDLDPVPLRAYGLGAGGIDEKSVRGRLQWTTDGCTTAGGVRIECQPVGVKLTFPSGCELLFATDGVLHLRSGEKVGPFPFGAELRLGDGTNVRVLLAQGQRDRLREVAVVDGETCAWPWQRGKAARDIDNAKAWGGVRLCCCGEGGDVYRAVALGPLIVLDRLLVAADREATTPRERLVVLTAALVKTMSLLRKQHTAPDPDLRQAVGTVAAIAGRADVVFPAGASLLRAERHQLRWVLRAGYELELSLTGQNAPRLAFYSGRSLRPMVEWTLLGTPSAFLPNPSAEPGASHWHGNGMRLPRIAQDLQARAELFEQGYALEVLKRLPK